MDLGVLFARLETEQSTADALEALGDLVVYSQVASAAERYGEQPGEYLAASAGQFASMAGDESWLALVAAMERAPDPGQAAMLYIARWAIARDAAPAPEAHSCSCEATSIVGG
jgi:hypothetical protein